MSIQSNIKSFVVGTLLCTLSLSAVGQESEKKIKLSLEIDPLAYAGRGYSAHLRIQPRNSEHLLLGIGTAAFDMPEVFVNLNAENNGEGWTERISNTVGLFGEYHFSEVNSKWFLGGNLAFSNIRSGMKIFQVRPDLQISLSWRRVDIQFNRLNSHFILNHGQEWGIPLKLQEIIP